MNFPHTLHRMLENAKVGRYEDIVTWQPHGRSFRMLDTERFVADV
jgi:HSF-type DNA-binding